MNLKKISLVSLLTIASLQGAAAKERTRVIPTRVDLTARVIEVSKDSGIMARGMRFNYTGILNYQGTDIPFKGDLNYDWLKKAKKKKLDVEIQCQRDYEPPQPCKVYALRLKI
jgi:hypothetical protein